MLFTLFDRMRSRIADYRSYRRTIGEIEAMSSHDLFELRVYRDELRQDAWHDLIGR